MKQRKASAHWATLRKLAGGIAILLVAGGVIGFFIPIELELSLGDHRRVGIALHPAGVRFYNIEYLQPMPGLSPLSMETAASKTVPTHQPVSILGPDHWGSEVTMYYPRIGRPNPPQGHPPTGHRIDHYWIPAPFVAFFGLSSFLIWSLMKAHSRNICVTCGYDLRATSRTGACPECGTQREVGTQAGDRRY